MGDDYDRRRFKRKPQIITSYGIILFTDYGGTKLPEFLLYRRRDTFEYIDFLRGGWHSEDALPHLFSMMTPEERDRLGKYSLRELWDDLWVEHECKIYKDGFIRAKRKYDTVADKIADILSRTESRLSQPPMGWPKGKKNVTREDPIDCAVREFVEETRIDLTRDNVWSDMPYIENFRGGNGRQYRTYYYVAYIPYPQMPVPIATPQCIRKSTISEEAAELHWLGFLEACSQLNYKRQVLLTKILERINNEHEAYRLSRLSLTPGSRPPGL